MGDLPYLPNSMSAVDAKNGTFSGIHQIRVLTIHTIT
jgi:hypothetical protein